MIYCVIRIQRSWGGGCNVALTPILNLCNQLESHFYSQTVAVIQSVTPKSSDNKSSPQPAAESRWSPLSLLISTPQPATAGLMR